MKRDLVYAIACLAFAIIIGGAVYEHLNVVPVWAAAPPVSLSMFQGEYGLKPETFWKFIHPVTLVLFAQALIVHWKSPRRKPILIAFIGYAAILAITAVFFVPELLSITSTSFATTIDPSLTRRASLWETLSLVRLGVLITLAVILLTGLAKESQYARKSLSHA